jgi:hypothetical protein
LAINTLTEDASTLEEISDLILSWEHSKNCFW